MTMDKSLRIRKALVKVRSVLTRAERIKRLQQLEQFGEDRSPLGLPKVRVPKISMKKKKKKAKEEAASGQAAKK
ncbi:MAG: small basic protein [Thermogutta sp.]|nr:small basic protein [Thermogutta sp.]HOP78424.1 small basic protein [Thermogutta sp.]HPU07663.1 small basic protein [Thermogutta sp.]HQF13832.1 small basic protein [Thermogutta sp.]